MSDLSVFARDVLLRAREMALSGSDARIQAESPDGDPTDWSYSQLFDDPPLKTRAAMAEKSSQMVAFTRYDEALCAPEVALICEAYRRSDGTGTAFMLRGRHQGSGLRERYIFESGVESLDAPGLPSPDAPYGAWQLEDFKTYIDQDLQSSLRISTRNEVAKLFGYAAISADGARLHRGHGSIAGRKHADGAVTENSRTGIIQWIDNVRREEEFRLVAGFWTSGKVLTAISADLHLDAAEEASWEVKFTGLLGKLVLSDNKVRSTTPWTPIANPWK